MPASKYSEMIPPAIEARGGFLMVGSIISLSHKEQSVNLYISAHVPARGVMDTIFGVSKAKMRNQNLGGR